jgi:L-cystine uptake protein TcyP (sodium:dicarboxylate symporter family)
MRREYTTITDAILRGALTLLFAAVVAYAAVWLLQQIVLPLIVIAIVAGIARLVIARREGW